MFRSASARIAARTFASAALVLGLAWPGAPAAHDFAGETQARQRLHQQQLQQSLDLSLQQSVARSQLQFSPAERARFDALANSQRMAQQHLHHDQALRERVRPHPPAATDLRRRLYAQEGALQLRRFEHEQRTLLHSAPPPALQPGQPPGALMLP